MSALLLAFHQLTDDSEKRVIRLFTVSANRASAATDSSQKQSRRHPSCGNVCRDGSTCNEILRSLTESHLVHFNCAALHLQPPSSAEVNLERGQICSVKREDIAILPSRCGRRLILRSRKYPDFRNQS